MSLKLMCVLAHPDDESLALGGTLAKYAEEGVELHLVVATRGERGWFGKPEAYPGPTALGLIREQEVRQASRILGIEHLYFLDYIDGDLDQADASAVIAQLVYLLRLVRPNVVITFGPDGLYGHPDHIAISQFTTSAIVCAADAQYRETYLEYLECLEPHSVSKLYYRVASQSWLNAYMPIFGELVMQIDGQERRALPWVNWAITTRLDTSGCWQRVWQAVRCHHTQLPPNIEQVPLSAQDHLRFWGSQEFYRAFSRVNGGRREEHDLFEGLRIPTLIVQSNIQPDMVRV